MNTFLFQILQLKHVFQFSLFRISLGISSSAIGLKFYSITGGIKMCKSIIKKKKEKQ